MEEEVGIPSLLSLNIQATFQPAPQQVIPPHQIHRPLPQVTVASQIAPRGYSNNPTMLTHSRRLSEIAGGFPLDSGALTSTPNVRVRGPGPNITSAIPAQFRSRTHQDDYIHNPQPAYRKSDV